MPVPGACQVHQAGRTSEALLGGSEDQGAVRIGEADLDLRERLARLRGGGARELPEDSQQGGGAHDRRLSRAIMLQNEASPGGHGPPGLFVGRIASLKWVSE